MGSCSLQYHAFLLSTLEAYLKRLAIGLLLTVHMPCFPESIYLSIIKVAKYQARMAWVQAYNNNNMECTKMNKERGIPEFLTIVAKPNQQNLVCTVLIVLKNISTKRVFLVNSIANGKKYLRSATRAASGFR